MSPEIVTTLLQAPLVLIVIVSGFYLLKEFGRQTDKRDVMWHEFIEAAMKSQNETAREVAISIEKSSNRTTDVLDQLTKQITINTATILLHDATVRGTNTEVIGTTEEIVEKLLRR